MHDDELRFISDINTKKEIAWKKLYRNYYPALCNYAAQITRNEINVEDIVQESLISLWDSSVSFTNLKTLTSWLYKAVYTRSLNNLRDQTRANKLHLSFWDTMQETQMEEEAVDMAIEEELLHNLLLRYKPGSGISSRVVTPEVNEIVVNPNATLDWQLALRQAAGKTDLARDMLQMLLDFLPEVRNKVEEQLVGENPEGLVDLIHKLHGSCGYSGVPRMKNLCQLIEQQLRSGTKEEDLEPELLELLDEMDNVAREASKILG